MFKSANMSIWSVFLVINEFESKVRYQIENMLFSGLWYSSKKPEASLFSEPLYKELKILEKQIEVQIYADSGFINRICGCISLQGISDLPAWSLVTETVQFNGKYGCVKCYQEVKSCKTEKGFYVWVYPYAVEYPKGPERTNRSFREDALNPYKKNKTVIGLKNPTWLHLFSNFDLVN